MPQTDVHLDAKSLLSSDYFNHFDEIIMLLGLLPKMPEMIDEIEAWKFHTYVEHFQHSNLAFAAEAIDAYERSPREFREPFDAAIEQMHRTIEHIRIALRTTDGSASPEVFREQTANYVKQLQHLVERGSALTRGCFL